MTDLEPITTPEAYESAREMARQYEQRLAEHQRELNALEEEALALMAKNTERRKEIIANLKTGLWALEAQCHDYELNSIDCGPDTRKNAPMTICLASSGSISIGHLIP